MSPERIAALLCLAAIAGLAAWFDIRERRIPNWLCGVNLLAGLGFVLFAADWRVAALAAVHALVALAIGFALSVAGAIGAGDAKFYASMAAWFPIQAFLWLLVSVALAGLALLIVFFILRRIAGKPVRAASDDPFAKLPYGIAIGLGGLAALASG